MTLIELLVVVVLIAVVCSLLIPAAGRAREHAGALKCMSNLRSCGLLLLVAIKENGSNYNAWYSGSAGEYWNTMLIREKYLDATQLEKIACPKVPYKSETGSYSGRHYGLNMADPYGVIVKVTNPDKTFGNVYRINVTTHPQPSQSIFLADSTTNAGAPTIRIFPASSSFASGGIHIRHSRMANIFFLDGHSELATPARLGELGVEKVYGPDLDVISIR